MSRNRRWCALPLMLFLGLAGFAPPAGAQWGEVARIATAIAEAPGLAPAPDSLTAAQADTSDTSVVLDAMAGVAGEPERGRKRFKDLKPGHDLVHGFETLGGDMWAVATGPLHMDRTDALLTLGAIGIAGALYAYDREVLDGMHRSWDAPIYGPFWEFGDRYEKLGYIGAIAPYYLGGFVVTYLLRLDPLPRIFIEAAESNFVTGLVRNALEMSLRRTRPRENPDPRTWFVKGGDSFPSGHASVVFELATIAAHHTKSKPLRILYYLVATSVSVARAQVNSHWPSDVFVGACIGTVVARTIVRRHDR